MKVEPTQDRVLIYAINQKELSTGGLHIPESAQAKSIEGRVVAVGPGWRKDDGTFAPLDIKPGDKVLFTKYGGSELTVDGMPHIMLREDDILAIVK